MSATLADHARRGAQEASDLLYRVRRVKTGYEQREPSDARDQAVDYMRVSENTLDGLAFYLNALAQELDKETPARKRCRASHSHDPDWGRSHDNEER